MKIEESKNALIATYKKSFENSLNQNMVINYSNIVETISKIHWINCELRSNDFDLDNIISEKNLVLNFKGTVNANAIIDSNNSQRRTYGFKVDNSEMVYLKEKQEFQVKYIGDITWDERI